MTAEAEFSWATPKRQLALLPAWRENSTMAATEYKGYQIEPSETSGKWRASIRRSDDLEIRVGTGRYKSFRTGEFPTEREAIERAHKLIDNRAIV